MSAPLSLGASVRLFCVGIRSGFTVEAEEGVIDDVRLLVPGGVRGPVFGKTEVSDVTSAGGASESYSWR